MTEIYCSEYVRRHLEFDPYTGVLRWMPGLRRKGVTAGEIAGYVASVGYIYINILRRMRLAHRIAWLHFYGEEPDLQIDHIDGNRTNNRIANLRLATRQQNSANSGARAHNRLGIKGVRQRGDKFLATITVDCKHVRLGQFETAADAHAAYLIAARANFGEFARGQ